MIGMQHASTIYKAHYPVC